jgi:L-aminopeptidase/D-esterase-like protein
LAASSDLLDDHIDLISVFHVEILGGLGIVESFPVEQEANVGDVELHIEIAYTLSLAICVHELLELGCVFDLEEDLLAILRLLSQYLALHF